MRGFLQRIAASAVRLEPALHPFVGAMFQSAPREEIVEAPSPIERASVAESVARGTTAIPAPEPVAAERGADLASERPLVERAAVVKPKELGLVVSHKAAEVEEPVLREKESRREEARSPKVLPAASARREQAEPEATSILTLPQARPLVLQPFLVGEMPKRDMMAKEDDVAGRPPQTRSGAVSARADRLPGMERGASLGTKKRATQDVQIHIGRVEVVAVPAAPTPPAPKLIRRSLNLEEYLKHRDTRGA